MSGSAGMGVSGKVERGRVERDGKRGRRAKNVRNADKRFSLYNGRRGWRFMARLRRRYSGHMA